MGVECWARGFRWMIVSNTIGCFKTAVREGFICMRVSIKVGDAIVVGGNIVSLELPSRLGVLLRGLCPSEGFHLMWMIE